VDDASWALTHIKDVIIDIKGGVLFWALHTLFEAPGGCCEAVLRNYDEANDRVKKQTQGKPKAQK
jgi:hypothetical protein